MTTIDLTGKVAIVTGGSRGIGKAIALAMAQNGASIALVYRHASEQAEQTLKELRDIGCDAEAFVGDVSCFDEVQQQVAAIHERFGHIDILVNNAGITHDTLLMRMSEQQWDDVINTNLKSVFNYAHACTPIMMRQRQGVIINMASVVGISGNAGQANYAASKAGIIAFTKSLARELGSRNIRVNAIAPGFIDTEMTLSLSPEQKESILQRIALRRQGTPKDVARCALFLASDLATYVTGQTLVCDGGMS
ncbi:MAG: 3-oxoacyl-[acyl-carrier-protein] reductase [Bacteroidales bacterium]|nr:3-oxoacyl-[acyl-carrier-protein] reductase [Bacteroidales bacterium]